MNFRRDADSMTVLTGGEVSHRSSRCFDWLRALDCRPHGHELNMLYGQVLSEPAHCTAQSEDKPKRADHQVSDQSCREQGDAERGDHRPRSWRRYLNQL